MKGSILQFQLVRDVLFVGALAVVFGAPTYSAEPFEVMMHEDQAYGATDIESGDFLKGVTRLQTRLERGVQSFTTRTPIVIDLCVGYTMLENFDEATRYCDEAVDSGWATGLALNNRGALNIAKGEFKSAIRDFEAALDADGADAMARRNLRRVHVRIAELRKMQESVMANVAETER
jgi:Flp pilus assembly protein TadD